MQQQYKITVGFNPFLRNCSFDADGLITLCELLPGASLPTNINRFQYNCILNQLDGSVYRNIGSPAAPNFTVFGSGSGGAVTSVNGDKLQLYGMMVFLMMLQ